jgi:hypothetical protein
MTFQPGVHAVRDVDGITICMAHKILGLPPDIPILHINGDTLDNRRENLKAVGV